LNEINNIHEKRLTALRNHVPVVVVLMLIGSAMVAMGFTGYNAGVTGAQRHLAGLIMSIMIAALIVLVIDLDRPYQGLIQVSPQALVDAIKGFGP
jgi:membrane associated rhomboid family serine protease